MPKPKLGYLLFDLPSDHEVQGALATESKVIEALILNRGEKAKVKRVCIASKEQFMECPTYKYKVQFVHLACHGGPHGIGLLGGEATWNEVSTRISRFLHPLTTDQQRVIVFSCCHSRDGYEATRGALSTYFTGAYYFGSS